MVKLAETDIQTKEVLGWHGVHLMHFPHSSCSQKTRIFLALKGIAWQSHIIDLPNNQNLNSWFLGVNPRGLVPVLVHDGDVHIESNDILAYLDSNFSGPRLFSEESAEKIEEMLHFENDLHMDLRTLTFRFAFPEERALKGKDILEVYRQSGSGTVAGKKDLQKNKEIQFWESVAEWGITDSDAQASVAKFRNAFNELDRLLAAGEYILGDHLSVMDVAWFVYVNRIRLCGYPFDQLHKNLIRWFENLVSMPEFRQEITLNDSFAGMLAETQRRLTLQKRSFADVIHI